MAGTEYKRRDFVKILKRNGFKYSRSTGGHDIYTKNGKHISIQVHPNAMQCKRLIKEYSLIV